MFGSVTLSPSGLLVAFGAGIASFLSPCVLPLVPGYLSMVTGLSTTTMGQPNHRGAVFKGIAGFIAGFTVVFVLLGAAASSIGKALLHHKTALAHVSGIIVICFGLALLLSALPAGVWTRLGARGSSAAISVTRERRFSLAAVRIGPIGGLILGAAFAFAWTPCIGPVLGAVLTLAANSSTVLGGMALLTAYSLGLAVPFVAAGFGVDKVATFSRRHGRALVLLQGIGALVLIGFGILLLTDQVGWLSSKFSSLLSWLHLTSLTTS